MQVVFLATGYASEFGEKVTSFVTKETLENKYSLENLNMELIVDVPFNETDEKVASIIYNIPDVQFLENGVIAKVDTLKLKKAIAKALFKEGYLLAEIYI